MSYAIYAGRLIDLHSLQAYDPSSEVQRGISAADMALKPESGVPLSDALWFAGHHEMSARWRMASARLAELEHALNVLIEDDKSGDAWAEPAPEPEHVAVVRRKLVDAQATVVKPSAETKPLRAAAAAAGGVAYAESNVVT